ncbi:hypothetical protein FLJC2902T_13680 [Flavobacterium limnosediminis JC2902]|uniref:DUF998 domain-containing protein n=1 Tax=Flavobacterium limnosediminis JC2902 TaxID=1341181 RepID=V6SRG4_9FLAO|nr:hypothetical protein [Flavobacterium limnosediminis]ESU28772.1 hypothetical protein FLJC2902T_13680 [Flavobacterium limnosediminis JC2902]
MNFLKSTPELISYKQLRLFVGATGFFLPIVLIAGDIIQQIAENIIQQKTNILKPSISHYYYSCMGDVFVGLLCAVAIFLFTYKGHDKEEGELLSDNITGNIACIFALGVAFFPTAEFNAAQNPVSWIHYIAAGCFFSSLAYFSLVQFIKSKGELTPRKIFRNKIYKTCGWTIVFSIIMLLLYNIPAIKNSAEDTPYFITFEILALWAFAFSWLVKAEVFFADKKKPTQDLSEN